LLNINYLCEKKIYRDNFSKFLSDNNMSNISFDDCKIRLYDNYSISIEEIESIESSLEAILAKDIDKYKSRYSQLTSRESEICSLIETGLSSKQISEKLSLSVLTISKHREQIRKKLKISNKNVNLATYLRTYSKK